MCGIAGLVRANRSSQQIDRCLSSMLPGIASRGPDGQGHFVDHEVGLLHTRLAIIDLLTGEQPIWNERRTVACVFNGEIYNFKELRAALLARGHRFSTTTDTEVLVHLYEEHGAEVASHLHGMFAFALWDTERRRLVLSRDRLGIKPLFVAKLAQGLAFASSIAALAALPEVSREPDPVALAGYVRKYKVAEPRTAYRGVQTLLPGHTMTLAAPSFAAQARRFADLPSTQRPPATGSARREAEARAAFDHSIASHLVADVEVGAFLSGGIDSTLVVARAQQLSERPLRTFSISFREHGSFDESAHAARVASALGTKHQTFDVSSAPVDLLETALRATGQPFAVASFLPLLLLCDKASHEVKVVLTGDGGDEVGGGYPWYRWMRLAHGRRPMHAATHAADGVLRRGEVAVAGRRSLRHLRRAVKFARGALLPPAEASDAWRYELTAPEAASLLAPPLRDAAIERREPEVEWDDDSDAVEALRRWDLRVLLRDEMLPKLDRAGMAFGLEGRVPLLDDTFVDAMLRVPMSEHLAHSNGKALLRRWATELCPGADTGRPKHGFDVPIGAWLDGALRGHLQRLLLAPSRPAIFDPAGAAGLVSRMRHGVPGAGHTLYAMLLASLWFETSNA